MDISKLFDDNLIEVEIINKITGKPVGVKMWFAPLQADATADAWIRSRILIDRASGKTVSQDEFASIATQADYRKVAASIRKWDWGGHEWADLGKDPKLTPENALKVFLDPRAGFIVEQVMQKAMEAANFTPPPEKD